MNSGFELLCCTDRSVTPQCWQTQWETEGALCLLGVGDREDQTQDIAVLIHSGLTTQLNSEASCKPFCGLIPACMGQGPDEQQQKQT